MNDPQNSDSDGSGQLHRLVRSFTFLEHLGLLLAVNSLVERASRRKTLSDRILEELSEWFRVKLSTAGGATKIVRLEPREFLRESLLTLEAVCDRADFGKIALRGGKNLFDRVNITAHGPNEKKMSCRERERAWLQADGLNSWKAG